MTRVNLDNPARPLVCIDLNGVLDTYTGSKHPDHWDPSRPGARESLEAIPGAERRVGEHVAGQHRAGQAIAAVLFVIP
jgi:hypothetical protein